MIPQSQACTKKCNGHRLYCRSGLTRRRDHNKVHPHHHMQERRHPCQSKGNQRLWQSYAVHFQTSLDGVWRKISKSMHKQPGAKARKLQHRKPSVDLLTQDRKGNGALEVSSGKAAFACSNRSKRSFPQPSPHNPYMQPYSLEVNTF